MKLHVFPYFRFFSSFFYAMHARSFSFHLNFDETCIYIIIFIYSFIWFHCKILLIQFGIILYDKTVRHFLLLLFLFFILCIAHSTAYFFQSHLSLYSYLYYYFTICFVSLPFIYLWPATNCRYQTLHYSTLPFQRIFHNCSFNLILLHYCFNFKKKKIFYKFYLFINAFLFSFNFVYFFLMYYFASFSYFVLLKQFISI